MTSLCRHVSAQDTILCIHRDIVEVKSTVQTRTIVVIDVKKAFDIAARQPIVEKAKRNNVGPTTIWYLTDFVTNRLVKIKVEDRVSNARKHTAGAHQGVTPSQILVNLSMSDLTPLLNAIPGLQHAIYGDGITICSHTGCRGIKAKMLPQGTGDVAQCTK
ncbi:hypothetical protein HPB48_015912 [Haemaphysalis longicornis]|uniref:Reverse transcriptase domain-containing protein n=1 Tax=Haemaphysalis longicornis TaxID=44386 RepID=A0A9J6GTV5_HAELO|nr:hypothetical protein HPB48_015912 [Haemaphysalis longicornis]